MKREVFKWKFFGKKILLILWTSPGSVGRWPLTARVSDGMNAIRHGLPEVANTTGAFAVL